MLLYLKGPLCSQKYVYLIHINVNWYNNKVMVVLLFDTKQELIIHKVASLILYDF